MIGDIKQKYCPVCDKKTDHEQGCFKSKSIGRELFHLDVSTDEALKNLSSGFRDFVIQEQDGVMDADSSGEFAQSPTAGLDFETLFASTVRSLKCDSCGHLIPISR